MKKEKAYKIIATTDGWIASRDIRFKGKTEIVIAEHLTLEEAREELLLMFCKDYEVWYPNWGLCVNSRKNKVFGADKTYADGTRAYTYDSRRYSIEEEEEDC